MTARALTLLLPLLAAAQDIPLREAVRFDQQQKCREAESLYQQILARGPATSSLLNNLGNHYLICGDAEKARVSFESLLKLNPQHSGANLQLARIATERRQGAQALEYLAHVNDNAPATRILRAEAMYWAGKRTAALAALDGVAGEVRKASEPDALLEYLYGMTCARIGAYDRAVAAFNAVLVRRPDDYEVLFNLGRAAARAKQYDRALQALEVAVKLQPDNVDALLELAGVNIALRDYARALYTLVRAAQLAPDRPEIALALAHAAQAGAYYGDAALAFDRYLLLKPDDDGAQRDRALAYGFTDGRQAEGLKRLREYIGRHPEDALGPYYLAQLTWRDDPQAALRALESALRLDPKLAAAHVDLGWLMNRQGRTSEAVPHFERAIAVNPGDARALDQLGAAYLSLDRPVDSAKVLRKAFAISPSDPEIMMHLGRALMESGHEDEGRQILETFKNAHTARSRGPWRQPGMIESASLSASERSRHEVERLRREAGLHPDDPELELRLATLLLAEGRLEEAEREFRLLLSRNADARIWYEAGRFLLASERYVLAREFLQRAVTSFPVANVDLAAAVFFSQGPDQALAILNDAPATPKTGDYWLLKAKILDVAGQHDQSAKTLEQGLDFTTSSSKLVQEAVTLLVQQGRPERALEFVTRAANGNSDLLLTRAILLAITNQRAAAEKVLKEVESQWPEWDRPYLVHGMLLEKSDPHVAKQKLQTALALGSQEAFARCTLAHLTPQIASGQPSSLDCTCASGLEQMILSSCAKP